MHFLYFSSLYIVLFVHKWFYAKTHARRGRHIDSNSNVVAWKNFLIQFRTGWEWYWMHYFCGFICFFRRSSGDDINFNVSWTQLEPSFSILLFIWCIFMQYTWRWWVGSWVGLSFLCSEGRTDSQSHIFPFALETR